MISIVVPAYNCESTIHRCVDSILSQKYTNYELIIVDDGSFDRTPTICDTYADGNDKISVIHKPNGGVSSARNLGIDKSKGEWITFVDSDDKLANNALSLISSAIEEQQDSSPNLIQENIIIIHSDKTKVVLYGPELHSISQLYHQGLWGSTCIKTFNKKILDEHKIRFNEEIHFCEDCLFVAQYCSYVQGLTYIETPCYIQYEPESYKNKYKKYSIFKDDLFLYKKIKEVNRECSQTLVDGLVMSLLKNGEQNEFSNNIRELKEAVAEDIKYVAGFRKIGIRFLKKTDCVLVWTIVLGLYTRVARFL